MSAYQRNFQEKEDKENRPRAAHVQGEANNSNIHGGQMTFICIRQRIITSSNIKDKACPSYNSIVHIKHSNVLYSIKKRLIKTKLNVDGRLHELEIGGLSSREDIYI